MSNTEKNERSEETIHANLTLHSHSGESVFKRKNTRIILTISIL